uniref:Flavin-containing monooxygenase n=1 Tax=Eptatretus burgeri TaxID=7764 RepID=A0A8C4NMR3_EPTBU
MLMIAPMHFGHIVPATMVKRVCVIGAGASGLASIKCCLDEGLEPTCFEMGDDIGGLWKYHDEVIEGQASIYQSLVTNTSKEMMCFSDFPMPTHFPVFLHHTVLFQYFQLYAKKFQLTKYIHFKTKVTSITKQADFPLSGQWNIMIVDENGKEEKLVFDAVMLCSGLQINPHLPLESFPGIQHFRGRYLHSHDYKKPQEFQGQRVLVIGASNSGVDVAVAISDQASQVYLSTRSGVWVFDPLGENGHPYDMSILSRWIFTKLRWCSWEGKKIEQKLNQRFDHANFGLQCNYRCIDRQGTINNPLPYRILSGTVIVKSNVESFTETEPSSKMEPVLKIWMPSFLQPGSLSIILQLKLMVHCRWIREIASLYLKMYFYQSCQNRHWLLLVRWNRLDQTVQLRKCKLVGPVAFSKG